MAASPPNIDRHLAVIAACTDANSLRQMIANARRGRNQTLVEAAFKRLITILPAEQPGTLEHDFWKTIHAFEEILSAERGKTTRLSRTRQKVARVGVVQTLIDWALDTAPTEGFDMLKKRQLLDLSGEAVILRHPDCFSPDVRQAAQNRLNQA